jgi:predicted site-specific integrase-resolvase
MSKIEAYQYLDISRATFNNYISKGLIPEGKKKAGFNEKIWYKYDLDKFKLLNNKK